MICPFCESPEHRVVESRVPDTKDAIRRRRECLACGKRFTSYERIEEMPLVVVKRSGERETFDRQKLLDGLLRACHKRSVSTGLLDAVVRDIEIDIRNRLRQEVRSSQVGDLALRRLKEIDQVAYVRFASVYRQFADVEEFEEELARLEREPPLPRGQGSLDEHVFDTLSGSVQNGSRTRLRALRGGRDAQEPAPDALVTTAPATTATTTTPQEVHDGD